MKNLILTALVVLMSASMLAQKTKTIVNPYYEFKTTGIYNVSKIELSNIETKLHIHNVFLPNWWVDFSKDLSITDSETGEVYKVVDIERAKFEEKIWMPASGDSTIVLVFPPIGKKVKQINYNNRIFGISLDKNLSGMKSNYSVSTEIETWMNDELTKCKQAPLKDYSSKDFFKDGTAKIVGCINGYLPKSDIKTGIIYLSNYLTREDYPIVVEVKPNGCFEVELPLISPIYSRMQMGNAAVPFYLEQGQTLGMIIEWEEILEADRLRDRTYMFQDIRFKGQLAKVNSQLLNFNFEFVNHGKLRKAQEKMSLEQKVTFYDNQKEMEIKKLDFYAMMKGINRKKTYSILKNKILLKHGQDILSIAMRRSSDARRDTANKELQEPLPDSFYDFLKDVPLQNQALCINEEFKWFINRYEYSNLITKHRAEAYKNATIKVSFFEYLLDNEESLSKEDKEYCILKEKIEKTTEETAELENHELNFGILKDRYGNSYQKWNLIVRTHHDVIENKMWALASIEMLDRYGIESNLTTDIAKLRSLNYRFSNANERSAEIVWGDLKKTINHPYLLTTGDNLYKKAFGESHSEAYQLPEGKAADIFNKIIAPHKGKVLVVDFWATSCGPCVSGIKRMKETRKQYASNPDVDFVFITNDRSTPLSKYDKFVKEQDLINTYRISNNDYLYLRQLFKFNGIPRYVVIDKDGKVLNDNFNMYQFEKEIAKLLVSDKEDLSQK